MSPLFEPIMKASLWQLTLKTVFLLKLASGRHRNELQALSCDEKCYRFRADGGLVTLLTLTGSCVLSGRLRLIWTGPMNRRSVASEPGCALILKSLKATFHWRTSPSRSKKLVQDAHEHAGVEQLRLAKVSAYGVWKFSASWAAVNCAPFDEIMQAADWKRQTTLQPLRRAVCTGPLCGGTDSHPASRHVFR